MYIYILFSGVRLYVEIDSIGPVDNFTVLPAADFEDIQDRILWCQSANRGTEIGRWYFPDSSIVSNGSSDATDGIPLFTLQFEGQIGLLRDSGIFGLEGLFRCVIPDQNEVEQTLWVAAYRTNILTDSELNSFFQFSH